MPPPPRRGLFWQVYSTLLISVVIVAVLGAAVWHLFGIAPMGPWPMRRNPPPGVFRLHSMGMLLSVAMIVGLAAYPVVSRITARLERLRLSVEAWGAGDLARRAVVDGRDEIAAVAASFNASADRADALLTAHKTLLAHASHELRSPLARLRLAVEMFAAGSDPSVAGAIGREIAELDALVEEILLASRLDNGADLGPREPVDCLALVAEEAARGRVGLRAVAEGQGGFEIVGWPRLMRRLVRNLVDNGLKHGAPPVEVEVRPGGTPEVPTVVIAVHDRGPGIPEDLRQKVFEPFFRPAGSSEDSGGWGLGLSLVRQIAERHGGRVLTAVDPRGAVFSVELPTIPADYPPSASLSR